LLLADSRFQLAPGTSPKFGLICFQLREGGEEESAALLEAVNASGAWLRVAGSGASWGCGTLPMLDAPVVEVSHVPAILLPCISLVCLSARSNAGQTLLIHTKLSGRHTLRVAIGATHTQKCHVQQAWQVIQKAIDAQSASWALLFDL
jgi:hypothetical protein